MMPKLISRAAAVSCSNLLLIGMIAAGGCTIPFMDTGRGDKKKASLAEITAEAEDSGTRLIKDVASAWNTKYVKLENAALVTGLAGTGSDPPPSPQRTALIDEMQTHEAKNPNRILASPDTALVQIRALLPPGVRKGDRIDVDVRVPPRSETTSLRGGWLMRTRLKEMAVLDNRVHAGRVDALAQGPVIVDTVFATDDDVHRTRGRVLGGGVAMMSRPLGLAVRSENHSIKTASLIGAAINARFHTYDRGIKKGVSTPKRDNYVELEVHPRYKHNVARYITVIRNIALHESPTDRLARIELLERKLHEPATSSLAAIQLEAIGKEAAKVLRGAVTDQDPEVRFYAAEALAYLDEPEATDVLAEAAANEPAFRWHAIAALAVMEHARAYDALTELMNQPSAETRYAAFRALKKRNLMDPLVHGELLDKKFHYHPLNTTGQGMVHFSRTGAPEIVLFGHDQPMQPPAFLYAGENIMLKAEGENQIKVIYFEAGKGNVEEVCPARVDAVIRAIVKVGGGYVDIMECLQEAKRKDYMPGRVVVDALPRPGRAFRRDEVATSDDDDQPVERQARSPLPDMFRTGLFGDDDDGEREEFYNDRDSEDAEEGFFGKLGDWFTG